MKVSVIGTGYVGLVSGTCLAEKGHQVVCVDVDKAKVDAINGGNSPIHEDGLVELLQKNLHVRLHATTDLSAAVYGSDLSLIAVGTPFDGTGIDLGYIKDVARQIGAILKHKESYHAVVVKSTVVPGTTDEVVRPLLEAASGKIAGKDFGLGMNPEFLRQGEAVKDFMNPDRIVLGGVDERSLDALDSLYQYFPGVDMVRTTNKTAEMIKYAANSLLATLISFSNEVGNLCTALGGIDCNEVMKGVHLDKRFSPIQPDGSRITPDFVTYLEAGCGFGGSCFPKDVKALIAHGKKASLPMHILDAVIQVNNEQPQQVLRLLGKHFSSMNGVRIAILGLAFKPGTGDMRESPAIPIVRALRSQGAHVKAFDPIARYEAEKCFNGEGLIYSDSLDQVVQDVDAVVLLTRWPQFDALPDLLLGMEAPPVVIDGRRMLDKRRVTRYEGIGL